VQLCQAIASRDLSAVQQVLARNEIDATINQGPCVPAAVVFTAARPGDRVLTDIGLELVKAGMPADANWPAAGAWQTAVEAAAVNGNVELVRALLAVGLNVQSHDAGRALIRAAEAGHLSVTRLLIDEGVDPEVTENNVAPLSRAVANGHDEVVAFLEETIAARHQSDR
jgi:hypothetical protein